LPASPSWTAWDGGSLVVCPASSPLLVTNTCLAAACCSSSACYANSASIFLMVASQWLES
jgi:hypothetical protein